MIPTHSASQEGMKLSYLLWGTLQDDTSCDDDAKLTQSTKHCKE